MDDDEYDEVTDTRVTVPAMDLHWTEGITLPHESVLWAMNTPLPGTVTGVEHGGHGQEGTYVV